MYAAERQQQILSVARAEGRVEVVALAENLGVTAETVRRDLTALERRGSLRRVHGGAIPVERLQLEPTLGARVGHLAQVKRRIAARALSELPHEGTILLDSGTTTQALVELLPPDLDLTVVTNSIPAAAALAHRPGISLYVLGGRVRGATGASVGTWGTGPLASLCADVAVMGTNGFSAGRGLTTPDQAEGEIKRALIRAARRTIVLADATKAGDDHLHRFGAFAEVDMLISDESLADEVADEIRSAGPEVVLA